MKQIYWSNRISIFFSCDGLQCKPFTPEGLGPKQASETEVDQSTYQLWLLFAQSDVVASSVTGGHGGGEIFTVKLSKLNRFLGIKDERCNAEVI